MTPFERALTEAALECYKRLCPHQERHDEYMATGRSTTAKAFVEGAYWARRETLANDPVVREVVTALEQALRQWNMYAGERECEDLENLSHMESTAYKACMRTLARYREATQAKEK